ncbi:MAG: LysR family transcriptional regulator, nitrogen assimilation regulatory protein [Azoarcus sp.]|nr:LysR family transcriptional regulator, nitrogen assimilation regulatory protein [Azoarcus sp.]
MELRQLRYFLAIAEHGSFSKAAAVVHVAQSALSHQLAQLEDELGPPLFHRLPRGVELTPAGRAFHPHAVSILRQVDDARQSVTQTEGEAAGKVIFGIPHSVSQALALPLLKAVRSALPRVELELTEELTGNLIPQLRTGLIHLAVLFDDGLLDEFRCHPLVEESLLLISPAAAPDAPRGPISLREALRMPLILPASPHGVRPIVDAAAWKAGLAAPNVIADISSISILRTSLLAGLGHTLLPPMPMQHELDNGTLRAVPIAPEGLSRRVVLCASRHIPASVATLAVARVLHALIGKLCRDGSWREARLIATGNPPFPER